MIKRRKAPYASSSTEPEVTILRINQLLKVHGVTNYQWTTLYDKGHVELKFAIETEAGKSIMISVRPPAFMARRRTWNAMKGKHEVVELPNWSQSLRLLFWWLKVKLEAVAYGLTEVENEFLSDTVVRLPNGQETTVGKAIRPRLSEGQLDLPSLEEKTPDRAVRCGPYVDVPYREGG